MRRKSWSWIYTFTRKPAVTKSPSIPFETLFQIYDCAVKFRQSCQWLANHLWVYDQCLSAIVGLFIRDIISSILIPACWAHSHLYFFSTIVALLAAILYNVSSHDLSLACCSKGTESGMSPPSHSTVLSTLCNASNSFKQILFEHSSFLVKISNSQNITFWLEVYNYIWCMVLPIYTCTINTHAFKTEQNCWLFV